MHTVNIHATQHSRFKASYFKKDQTSNVKKGKHFEKRRAGGKRRVADMKHVVSGVSSLRCLLIIASDNKVSIIYVPFRCSN